VGARRRDGVLKEVVSLSECLSVSIRSTRVPRSDRREPNDENCAERVRKMSITADSPCWGCSAGRRSDSAGEAEAASNCDTEGAVSKGSPCRNSGGGRHLSSSTRCGWGVVLSGSGIGATSRETAGAVAGDVPEVEGKGSDGAWSRGALPLPFLSVE